MEQSSRAHELKMASSWAERISVYAPSTALKVGEDGMQHWYGWQPGVLFPVRRGDLALPTSYGGLTTNKAHFVVVPADLVYARRQHYLRSLAERMGMKEPVQRDAYCEEAVQEILADPSPRSHPAFEADAFARRVCYWVALLSYRWEPQTADWRW